MKTIQERFESKFAKKDGCWEWVAHRNNMGYGKFALNGRMQYAHRVSYELYIGAIPNDLQVLHHCDNPACVNPSHLFIGTPSDNMRDCANKGRSAHPYGEKNTHSKLSEWQVKEIRARYFLGTLQASLSRDYSVTHQTISDIVLHKTWKGVIW